MGEYLGKEQQTSPVLKKAEQVISAMSKLKAANDIILQGKRGKSTPREVITAAYSTQRSTVDTLVQAYQYLELTPAKTMLQIISEAGGGIDQQLGIIDTERKEKARLVQQARTIDSTLVGRLDGEIISVLVDVPGEFSRSMVVSFLKSNMRENILKDQIAETLLLGKKNLNEGFRGR